MHPARCSANRPSSWTSPIRHRDVSIDRIAFGPPPARAGLRDIELAMVSQGVSGRLHNPSARHERMAFPHMPLTFVNLARTLAGELIQTGVLCAHKVAFGRLWSWLSQCAVLGS